MQAKHGDGEEDVEGSSPPKRLKPTKPIGKFELYTQAVRHLVKESMFAEVSSEWQREGRTPATPAEWKEFGKEVNRRVTKTVAANWRVRQLVKKHMDESVLPLIANDAAVVKLVRR